MLWVPGTKKKKRGRIKQRPSSPKEVWETKLKYKEGNSIWGNWWRAEI